jgi:fructokinase
MSGSAPLRVGVDLGGTKIEAVVVRLTDEKPEVLVRMRVPTDRDKGYEHVLSTTAALIADVTAKAGLSRPPPIGVGMPGSVTMRAPDGTRSVEPLVKNSNTTCLNGRPFRRELSERVGQPIAFANDANCFALAEAAYGAGRGAKVVFGVILGTGVGGGVVFRDSAGRPQIWEGAHGIAGEWGHVTLDPVAGRPCYCGKRGCIETYLCGPAIEQAYARRSGTSRRLPEIVVRRADDPEARSTLEDVIGTFGRALSTIVNTLDPDAIVLGGGVSNLDLLYDEGRRAVASAIFNDELVTRIEKHTLGDSAGVFGAALLNAP